MKLLAWLVVLATVLLAPTTAQAQDVTLTVDQQAWLDELSRDPTRVAKLMEAEEARKRMDAWDDVTEVTVADLHTTPALSGRDSTGPKDTFSIGEKTFAWTSIATPRHAFVPIDLQFVWYHEGSAAPYRMQTISVDTPSPGWRTWDSVTLRRAGNWRVEMRHGSEVLATTRFTVED